MKPAIVLPIHDPAGIELPYLARIGPDLKQIFECAFIGLSFPTVQQQPRLIEPLKAEPFFAVTYFASGLLPGDHFRTLFAAAAGQSPPDQTLHLCNLDRVAFALLTHHRQLFIEDVLQASTSSMPLLFQRSARAWETHPENYNQIEHLVIQVGEMLYGRYFDFGWSHLVIRSGLLKEVLGRVVSHDFGILIEMVLMLQECLVTRDVDWLAWEDPFILGRDPEGLKAEREQSSQETAKRLRGILPFFEHFLRLVPELNGELIWEKPSHDSSTG